MRKNKRQVAATSGSVPRIIRWTISLRISSGRWSSCGIPSGTSDVHNGLRPGSKTASLYLMTQDSK